jgi:hypothetical protein
MKERSSLGLAALLLAASHAAPAEACGGFFCGQAPVDQTAERILFEVDDGSVTMTSQIAFAGDAADFAWILPLADVPDVESLSVVPQRALDALDAQSGPQFQLPDDPACSYGFGCPTCSAGGPIPRAAAEDEGEAVDVYVQTTVGEYEVAVVGSEDPAALIEWLRDNGYRVTPPMEPYIALYTSEGLKFLALKLLPEADVNQLSAFRFTLPGSSPSIPLRMTALAAEPEMSIVVFVLADQRFEGRNWENVVIADDRIRFDARSYFPVRTNWTTLVAQAVDEADGQGWVTEFAGSSEPFASLIRSQIDGGFFPMPSDEEAARALLASFEGHPYMTRLATRVSAEEMTSDPIFGRSSDGDVDRERQLSRIVDGVDQCVDNSSTNPCDFTTCGAGGLCRPVPVASNGATTDVAACACLPGATARTTFAADGTASVVCQDGRMSFLNPGDRELDTLGFLPDTCVDFDCGDNGRCVAMNLTPTCVCDEGYVALGSLTATGERRTSCVLPLEPIPAAFYSQRLRALPEELPGGRVIELFDEGAVDGMPSGVDGTEPSDETFPMPRPTDAVARSSSDGGCSVSPGAAARGAHGSGAALLAAGLGWLATRRGRRHDAS